VLVAARAVQAVGAALIVPTSLGLLYPAFPKRQHAMVVGIWAGVAAVAGTAGPPIGGLLVGVDWRWIFLINVPIGMATLLGGLRVLPEVPASRREPAAGLGVGRARCWRGHPAGPRHRAGPDLGLGLDARPSRLLAIAVVVLWLTVMRTLRHPHALIERDLFTSRPFTGASIALFVFFVGFADLPAQRGAVPAGRVALQRRAVRARDRARTRRPPPCSRSARAGSGRDSAGCCPRWRARCSWWSRPSTGCCSPAPRRTTRPTSCPGLFAGGMSAGLTQAPLFAAAGTLPPDRATTGSAVLNMARQVGSAVGVAVVVVILGTSAAHTVTDFHHVWAAEVIAGLVASLAIAVTAGGRRQRV
jgi:hypothetical protein